MAGNFTSDEHALVSGAVFGALMAHEARFGVISPGGDPKVMPESDLDGNFTSSALLTLIGESGTHRIFRVSVDEIAEMNLEVTEP